MRAVSFLGDAARCVIGSVTTAAGLSGTVGRAPSAGGFGGSVAPPIGLTAALGMPGGLGAEGGGTKGRAPGAGVDPAPGSFVVSFFGNTPPGATGLPGTLIRTVSRFIAGWSLFGGSVMRMVSLFVTSSRFWVSEGAGGISSDITVWGSVVRMVSWFCGSEDGGRVSSAIERAVIRSSSHPPEVVSIRLSPCALGNFALPLFFRSG